MSIILLIVICTDSMQQRFVNIFLMLFFLYKHEKNVDNQFNSSYNCACS